MLEAVRSYCRQHALLPQGTAILVGVSGGADSVALLLVLHALRDEFGIKLFAAHLNHGFRGQEAEDDASFVERLCVRLNISCTMGFLDVPGLIRATGGSPQAVAREARFGFFRRVALQLGCQQVALGHHLDDQAETLLLNITRGSGVEGLTAMLPSSSGLHGLRVVRPLLGQRREAIEAFLATLGESYRIDSSNLSDYYARNYVRHQIMPRLSALNPKAAESLARLAQAAAADEAYFATVLTALKEKMVTYGADGPLINVEALCDLEQAVASRLIRAVWQQKSRLELSYQHVMAILGLCGKQAGKRIELPGGHLALRTGKAIALMEAQQSRDYALDLPVPGQVVVPGLGVLEAQHMALAPWDLIYSGDHYTAYLNAAVSALKVRTRAVGDLYQPLGAPGAKKLKQVLSEAEIPAPLRKLWPVVCNGADIVWVPGVRISEAYKVRDNRAVIRLRFIRGGN